MRRSIIIIDDFYSEPEKVRHIALNSPYPDPESTYTYPGKNSEDNYYPPELHNRFESILNRKLTPAQPNGYFRMDKVTYASDTTAYIPGANLSTVRRELAASSSRANGLPTFSLVPMPVVI